MGFGWAAANANIAVLLQEGGGGGTLGKAMALHMAAVLPTHSAHLICLDDQYDESIYKAKRIPVSAVPVLFLAVMASAVSTLLRMEYSFSWKHSTGATVVELVHPAAISFHQHYLTALIWLELLMACTDEVTKVRFVECLGSPQRPYPSISACYGC